MPFVDERARATPVQCVVHHPEARRIEQRLKGLAPSGFRSPFGKLRGHRRIAGQVNRNGRARCGAHEERQAHDHGASEHAQGANRLLHGLLQTDHLQCEVHAFSFG